MATTFTLNGRPTSFDGDGEMPLLWYLRDHANLKGAKFDRHIEFLGEDGKPRVRSRTDWAIIDKASGRPIRVPAEVIAPFVSEE